MIIFSLTSRTARDDALLRLKACGFDTAAGPSREGTPFTVIAPETILIDDVRALVQLIDPLAVQLEWNEGVQ